VTSVDPVNNYQTKFTVTDGFVYFESYRPLVGNGGPRDYQVQMNKQIDCIWAINENTYELSQHTEHGSMTVLFSATQGILSPNDTAVTSSLATRFDTSRLYISQQLKVKGDEDPRLVGPDLSDINEISCSFSSLQTNRLFTECCDNNSECRSNNCFMNEYCSETC
jgi:hypothetical protein